jgi:deoxyadenosine/deoxycytidine kinase
MPKRPWVVSIEGNIGSGKTTLLHHLEERYAGDFNGKKIIFLKEPVETWKSVQDRDTSENILQKFYKDPAKYAFSFQVMAYITFAERLLQAFETADENTIIVCERSMESCRFVFSKMLREQGKIDNVNYCIIEMFYNRMELIPVDAIIYLNVSVGVSNERIKKRGRLGEDDIPVDYLERCQKSYEDWLSVVTVPIITLDESEMIARIETFILSIVT